MKPANTQLHRRPSGQPHSRCHHAQRTEARHRQGRQAVQRAQAEFRITAHRHRCRGGPRMWAAQVMVDAVLSAAAAGGSHTCCVVGCTVGHLTSNPELHAEVTICWWIVGVLCFVVFLGGARPLQLLHVTHPIQSFFLLCVTSNPELHAEVTRPDRRPL